MQSCISESYHTVVCGNPSIVEISTLNRILHNPWNISLNLLACLDFQIKILMNFSVLFLQFEVNRNTRDDSASAPWHKTQGALNDFIGF